MRPHRLRWFSLSNPHIPRHQQPQLYREGRLQRQTAELQLLQRGLQPFAAGARHTSERRGRKHRVNKVVDRQGGFEEKGAL
jgi:hypothetical protein